MTTAPDALAARYWQRETAGDLEGVLACFHDDAQFVTAATTWSGIARIRERYAAAMAATARLEVSLGEPLVVGDRAAIRWAAIFDPVEGAPFGLVGINLFTIRADRFTRVDCFYDETPLDSALVRIRWMGQ